MFQSKIQTQVVKAAETSNKKAKLVKGTKKLLPPPECRPIYVPS